MSIWNQLKRVVGVSRNAVLGGLLLFAGLAAPAMAQPVVFGSAQENIFDAPPGGLARIDPGDSVSVSYTLFESPANFTESEFTVYLGTAIPLATVSGASTTCTTGTITGIGTGTLTFSDLSSAAGFGCSATFTFNVPAGTAAGTYNISATDLAGLDDGVTPFTAAIADVAVLVEDDDDAPNVTVSGPAGPVDGVFNATVNFNDSHSLLPEQVNGFDVNDLVVSNATVSLIGGGGDAGGAIFSANLEVTPTGGTPIEISLPAASVTDIAGNASNVSNTYSVVYDTTPDPADDVTFTNEFLTSPVAPSDTVTHRLTVTNNSAEDLTITFFTENLQANLTGLAASGAATSNTCGGTLSGTTFLIYTGGSVTAGNSCVIEVPVLVPVGAAPGPHVVQTSSLSASLATSGPIVVDAASTTIDVAGAEETGVIDFSKEFTDDPVGPGEDVTLEFTISAAGSFTTSNLSFTDDLDAVLSGLVSTSGTQNDVCGSGSSLSGTSTLTLTGGSLAQDASCTFSVTLAVPGGAADGDYSNTTSSLAATRSDIGAVTISAASDTLSVEVPAPTARIEGPAGPVSVASDFTVNLDFNEDVTGVEVADFTLSGVTISDLTGSGSSYVVDLTPTGIGTATVQFDAAGAQNGGAVGNLVSNVFSVEVQAAAPEAQAEGLGVEITSGDATPSAADATLFDPVDVAAGSSNTVFTIRNLGTSDLTLGSVTLATGTDFSVSAQPTSPVAAGGSTTFTVTFDPTASGTRSDTLSFVTNDADENPYTFAIAGTGSTAAEINVADASATNDIANGDATPSATDGTEFGNVNVSGAAPTATFTIENLGGSTLTLGSNAVSITGSSDFTVTSQPASSVAASGSETFTISFDPSTSGAHAATVSIANDDSDESPYTFAVQGFGVDNEAPTGYTVAFDAATYGPATNTAASFTIDAPEVGATYNYTISSSGGGTNVTGSGTIPVPAAGSPNEFQVTGLDVSGLGDGTLTVAVTLTDTDSNVGGQVTDTAVHDTTAPTPTLSTVSADPVSGAFTLDIDFGEAVTGFVIGDISVTNASTSGFSDDGGGAFSVTVTPAADGTVTADVAASAAQDAGGNDNVAATQFSIENDETAPTVAITSGASDPVSGAFSVTVTFSEAVSGFVVGDIAVGNGAASNLATSDNTTFTADITPAADGPVTVDVAASVAQDGAGNDNTAATQFAIENDETPPGVSSVDLFFGVVSPTDADVVSWQVDFSEDLDISTISGADFVATGTTATPTVNSLSNSSFEVSLAGGDMADLNATVTIALAASPTISDAAGNALVSTAVTGTNNNSIQVINDTVPPTLTITSTASDPVSGVFSVTFTFDEDVTGFASGDVTLSNGSLSNFQTVSATEYTADITPSADGTVTVDVAAAVAQDLAGNDNVAATQFSIENDETAPTVAITSGASDPVSGAFSVTVTFSEAVSGFVVGDIAVGNGAASNLATSDNTTFTADITPAADGPVTVDVAASVAQDGAGNDNTAATQFAIENDETPPGVTLATTSSDPVSGTFSVSFTFDESVTGFALADITVGNGSASNLAGSGTSYTADITPSTDGLVTVDVAADAAQDAAGNGNTVATQLSITNDETAPSVRIQSTASDPVSGAFSVSLVFSEAVNGFTLGDVTVGNGAASNLATSDNTTFTVDITPAADGTVTVDVAAGVAQDDAGNDNTAATQFSLENDETAPTVAITSGASDPVSGAFSVTVTFSEAVSGFAVGDLTVGNGSASNLATSDNTVFTADITPAADGTVTVDVAAAVAQDGAGNDNTAATQFSIENDETAPGVVISSTANDPVSGAFSVSFTFDETVSGFALGDISVGNGSASNFAGSGASYTADITPAADGTVTVDVAAGVAQDGAGNDNTAATQFSIENDETAPTVVISSTANDPVSGAFSVSFTFDETVSGFALADISVGNGAASNFAGSGAIYTADITPAADGTVTVDVAAGVAQDGAGNDNTAATQFSIENDETAPTVVISSTASDPVAGVFPVTFTFDESVTGFVLADITVGNGAASNFAGSGTTYTADITPAASGTVTVDVAAGVAQDTAGNTNTAATQFSIENDETAPTVDSVVVSDADVRNDDIGNAFTVTVDFSEAIDTASNPTLGFTPDASAAFSFQSGAFSNGDTTYTATFTVLDSEANFADVDVTVSGVADLLGNAMTDSTTADLFSVEQRRGSITIAATIDGLVDGDFDFTGDLGSFILATSGQSGSELFDELAEGSYSVAFTAEDGFSLDGISCVGGSTVTDASAGTLDVTLSPTDAVTCTFELIADPEVDEDDIPNVEITLASATDDPTAQTTTFDLTNTGGTAFFFEASTDAPWLTIDPTSGSIPASGSLTFTVSFTAAVLDLDPGTYNATITITETTAAPQKDGLARANTLNTITIPVTITLEPREGTLTLVSTTFPDIAGEGVFSYASDLAAFDGVTLTTVNGTASVTAEEVLRGSYDITQAASEGWRLSAITCTGDDDNGSVFDLANGTASIDLDPEETITCTFANVRDEEYIREITQSAIRSFMAARADQILTNSPNLSRRMREGDGVATQNHFSANMTEMGFRANFSTSLNAMRMAARDDRGPSNADDMLGVRNSTGMGSLDVWFEASYASVTDNRAGLDAESDFGMYTIGADFLQSENLLLGALVQFDSAETVTGEWRSRVEGDGWLAGPYMVARLAENLIFDARGAWGRSENEVNPIGTYWDDFETERWLVEANLTGDFHADGWRVTPELGVAYFTEEQAAYTDSLGIYIPSQEITIGRANFGPEFAYRFDRGEGGFVEPFVRVNAIWDYEDAEVINTNGVLQAIGDIRADARFGVNAQFANGGVLSAEVGVQGIGESQFEANMGMIRVRLPLSMD